MRKLIVKNLSLSSIPQLDASSPSVRDDIESYLDEQMEEILSSCNPDDPLPLIRVNVDITGFPLIPVQVFGAKYIGRIANPTSVLLLKRKRIMNTVNESSNEIESESQPSGFAHFDFMSSEIEKSLKSAGGLNILNNRHMNEACLILLFLIITSITVY